MDSPVPYKDHKPFIWPLVHESSNRVLKRKSTEYRFFSFFFCREQSDFKEISLLRHVSWIYSSPQTCLDPVFLTWASQHQWTFQHFFVMSVDRSVLGNQSYKPNDWFALRRFPALWAANMDLLCLERLSSWFLLLKVITFTNFEPEVLVASFVTIACLVN